MLRRLFWTTIAKLSMVLSLSEKTLLNQYNREDMHNLAALFVAWGFIDAAWQSWGRRRYGGYWENTTTETRWRLHINNLLKAALAAGLCLVAYVQPSKEVGGLMGLVSIILFAWAFFSALKVTAEQGV